MILRLLQLLPSRGIADRHLMEDLHSDFRLVNLAFCHYHGLLLGASLLYSRDELLHLHWKLFFTLTWLRFVMVRFLPKLRWRDTWLKTHRFCQP